MKDATMQNDTPETLPSVPEPPPPPPEAEVETEATGGGSCTPEDATRGNC